MRLDDVLEEFERDEAAERRRLAARKSYAVTDYLEDFEERFESRLSGDTLVGATAPSIFVGRSNYPRISTGVLSPVGHEDAAAEFATSGDWYSRGLSVDDVVRRRTGLLNSRRRSNVDVHEVFDGFVGVQREVAIADRPVDLEVGLDERPDLDLATNGAVATPTGPNARAASVELAENPHVPPAVEKTLEDDDWRAEGAMTFLYRRGFDVYDVNRILSAGALGRTEQRKLVPTRWSITAVDDTIGQYLRGTIRNAPSVDATRVWTNEYMGNRYWIVLAPGHWEFELVEMKAPESVWNPTGSDYYLASAREGYEGRTGYVDETAGAYYAARLGVLEHLADVGRQAKCLVLREVTDAYWAPVGVWQVRESVRGAFEEPAEDATGLAAMAGEPARAESFGAAVQGVAERLPVPVERLRRKSELAAGLQSRLSDFA